MADMDAKYDSALMGILSNEGEISKFLDAVFGFLYRRTDYFRLLITKEDKIGFPPGVAAKILLKEFHKYEQLAANSQKEKGKLSDATAAVTRKETPMLKEMPAPAPKQTPVPAPSLSSSTSAAPGDGEGETAGTEASPGKSQEEDMDTLETRQQKEFQANPMSYNGAVRDKYAWSQSISDVDIRVFVPSYIKKGKQVSVSIEKKHLRLSYLDESGKSVPVVDDDFTWEVDKEECMWTLAPGEHVHINLEKKEERWWEGALASEPKINVRKIDCSRPMTDLDDEAQAKIGEMMYNEQQKRLGLPQSHEQVGELRFVETVRGGKSLYYSNNKFRVNRRGKDKVYWKCCEPRCSAHITTKADRLHHVKNDHSHPDPAFVLEIDTFRSRLIHRSRTELTYIPQIYEEEVANLWQQDVPEALLGEIPSFGSVQATLYRHRQKYIPTQTNKDIIKTHEMLRKAWDAEGSPFKGQPFDPSVLSVDNSGMVTMKDRTGS